MHLNLTVRLLAPAQLKDATITATANHDSKLSNKFGAMKTHENPDLNCDLYVIFVAPHGFRPSLQGECF